MVITDSPRAFTQVSVNTALLKRLPDNTGIAELDDAIGKVKRLVEERRLLGVRIDALTEQKKGAANADRRRQAQAKAAGKKAPKDDTTAVAKVAAEIETARVEYEVLTGAIKIADQELDALIRERAAEWHIAAEAEIDAAWAEYQAAVDALEARVAEVQAKRSMAHFLMQARGGRVKSYGAPNIVRTFSDDLRHTTWEELFARLRGEATHVALPTPDLGPAVKAKVATRGGLRDVPIEPDMTRTGGGLYTAEDFR